MLKRVLEYIIYIEVSVNFMSQKLSREVIQSNDSNISEEIFLISSDQNTFPKDAIRYEDIYCSCWKIMFLQVNKNIYKSICIKNKIACECSYVHRCLLSSRVLVRATVYF